MVGGVFFDVLCYLLALLRGEGGVEGDNSLCCVISQYHHSVRFLGYQPVDYVAGAFMGVAVGLSWAKSFLHHEETEGAPAASSRST